VGGGREKNIVSTRRVEKRGAEATTLKITGRGDEGVEDLRGSWVGRDAGRRRPFPTDRTMAFKSRVPHPSPGKGGMALPSAAGFSLKKESHRREDLNLTRGGARTADETTVPMKS